jgi:hypothetical protein
MAGACAGHRRAQVAQLLMSSRGGPRSANSPVPIVPTGRTRARGGRSTPASRDRSRLQRLGDARASQLVRLMQADRLRRLQPPPLERPWWPATAFSSGSSASSSSPTSRRARRSSAHRPARGRSAGPRRDTLIVTPGRNVSVRPTSCSSAAASSRSPFSRGCSCAVLPADRGHRHRVLEQAAGVGVVLSERRRRAEPLAERAVSRNRATSADSPGWWISPARNSTMPSSDSASRRAPGAAPARRPAPASRGRGARSAADRRKCRPGPARAQCRLGEASVDDVDVIPDNGGNAARAIRQLDAQERVAGPRPARGLALHGEGRVNDLSVLQLLDPRVTRPSAGQSIRLLGDVLHRHAHRAGAAQGASIRPVEGRPRGRSWHPPYDVVTAPQRAALIRRCEYSIVVRLELPETPRTRRALLHEWRARRRARRRRPSRRCGGTSSVHRPDGVDRSPPGSSPRAAVPVRARAASARTSSTHASVRPSGST